MTNIHALTGKIKKFRNCLKTKGAPDGAPFAVYAILSGQRRDADFLLPDFNTRLIIREPLRSIQYFDPPHFSFAIQINKKVIANFFRFLDLYVFHADVHCVSPLVVTNLHSMQ